MKYKRKKREKNVKKEEMDDMENDNANEDEELSLLLLLCRCFERRPIFVFFASQLLCCQHCDVIFHVAVIAQFICNFFYHFVFLFIEQINLHIFSTKV